MAKSIKHQWDEMKASLSASGLAQSEIAKKARVSQPAVSRLMARSPARSGRAFKRLCIWAGELRQRMQQDALPAIEDATLSAAIREVWNGTPEHAQALAAMIRAAGEAARIATK